MDDKNLIDNRLPEDFWQAKFLARIHFEQIFNMPFCVEAPWKEYYTARNFTWMYKQSKWYKAIVFELIFVKIIAIFSMKCKKLKTIHMLFKGVFDGWRGNLGAKVKP